MTRATTAPRLLINPEEELEKGDLKKISNSELKSKIMRWDTERWRSDKESKTMLAVYNRFKKEISEIYINDYNSVLLYRCKSNTLKLEWRSRFVGGDVGFCVCGLAEVVTVEHFFWSAVAWERCDG